MQKLEQFFPFLSWGTECDSRTIRTDLIAGLVGAIIVLPQGVAFATIAGLPPQYGLYAAIVPAIIAALWGSSRHLVSGPTTAISLVVLFSLMPLAETGSERYITLALTLSFLVGILQFALGAFRLGTLVRLISPSVVVGFTAGAGILIASNQIKNASGIPIPQGSDFLETWQFFFENIVHVNPFILGLTLFTLIVGILFKRFLPKIPYMIPAILIGSALGFFLVSHFGVLHTGIKTIGILPDSLPPLSFPDLRLETVRSLAMTAFAITLLGLTEAVAIARAIGIKSGQRINGNQEFIGQGLSNIVGSFFSAYPSSGSFNRSGLNYESGAKTPLASVFAAIFLAIFVLFIGPVVAYIPLSVMAAILILVAYGIIDQKHIREIFSHDKTETGILIVTFLSTLFIELEFAIAFGVILSLTLFVRRVMFVEVYEVGKNTASQTLKRIDINPDTITYPGSLLIRIDMSVVYMNCDTVLESIMRLISAKQASSSELLQRVVLNMSGVNVLDHAGAEMIEYLAHTLKKKNITLSFISVKHPVQTRLTKHHLFPHLTLHPNLTELEKELATHRIHKS